MTEEGYFTEEVNNSSENLATEAQIKKIYALLHRLGIDPQKFKEEKGFTNYAKLTRRQASEMIDELERQEMMQIEEKLKASEETRAPEEPKATVPATTPSPAATTVASAATMRAEVRAEERVKEDIEAEEVLRAARLMKRCVSEAKKIVEEEMPFVVSEAIKAKTIGSIAATLFIQLEGRSHRWEM